MVIFTPLDLSKNRKKEMSKKEATLIVIKPDGIQKSLTGNILTRLSETKLVIIGAKMEKVSTQLAEEHYCHMKDKPFFNDIIKYLTGEGDDHAARHLSTRRRARMPEACLR